MFLVATLEPSYLNEKVTSYKPRVRVQDKTWSLIDKLHARASYRGVQPKYGPVTLQVWIIRWIIT